MNCLLFLSLILRYLSQHRQSTHRVMTACKIALEPTQTQTQIDALGVTKLLKLFFKQEDMDETKGRTNAQRSKVSSGLRFFFGVKSAVGLRFITSIVATHLHNDGGNTHTETYNLADKRSRTREGVNLQCESVKFFLQLAVPFLRRFRHHCSHRCCHRYFRCSRLEAETLSSGQLPCLRQRTHAHT